MGKLVIMSSTIGLMMAVSPEKLDEIADKYPDHVQKETHAILEEYENK